MRWIGYGVGTLIVLAAIVWFAMGADWRRMISNMPTNADVLFWSTAERDAAFRMMDRMPAIIPSEPIKTASNVRALEVGAPIEFGFDIDAYMETNRTSGLVILQDGEVRFEGYGLGFDDTGRWTSFSVAKSFTSTLVGAAIKDGFIESLDDPISTYVEGLRGSAYDDVTVEQLLTMSSGVAWNEDYEDPTSDVAVFNTHVAEDGGSNLVSYMAGLERAHPPGEVWNYSTGETNLIGILVREATGKTLTEYLSEKVWQPYGMQQDASWLLNPDGTEISGCCIQASTRDFARFGQFILEGAAIDGVSIVPDDWLANATAAQKRYGVDGEGYGYQWWTYDTGSFAAQGIFGQSIFIDPARQLVIASNSNWQSALGLRDGENPGRDEFHQLVLQAIDREQLAEAQ